MAKNLTKEINWARYSALAEIKGDLLNWLIFSEEEQKAAVAVIKKIEKYQKLLMKEIQEDEEK